MIKGKKLLSFFLSFLIFAVILGFSGVSFAASSSSKIGVIDMHEVVINSDYGKKQLKKLQAEFDKLKKILSEKAKKIQDLKKDLKEKSALLSKEIKKKKEKELKKLEEEYRALQQEYIYKLQSLQKKLLEPLFEKIKSLLPDFAKKYNYSLIIDKRIEGIYYTAPHLDITQKFIKFLNTHFNSTESH